ncbi:hypothetical protein [Kitasatospora sp. NPDC057936]|uniref:hypothetical protein n=1 Tax=Kitasatospora sp. NPDC057936 TaxID=3346283 RepID=UPI0036D9E0BB
MAQTIFRSAVTTRGVTALAEPKRTVVALATVSHGLPHAFCVLTSTWTSVSWPGSAETWATPVMPAVSASCQTHGLLSTAAHATGLFSDVAVAAVAAVAGPAVNAAIPATVASTAAIRARMISTSLKTKGISRSEMSLARIVVMFRVCYVTLMVTVQLRAAISWPNVRRADMPAMRRRVLRM